jgi:hypothetical protein
MHTQDSDQALYFKHDKTNIDSTDIDNFLSKFSE